MDNWHVLTRLPHKLPGPSPTIGAILESLDEIMVGCVPLVRFAMDDMTRDESWRFLLLEAENSIVTYRARYRTTPELAVRASFRVDVLAKRVAARPQRARDRRRGSEVSS